MMQPISPAALDAILDGQGHFACPGIEMTERHQLGSVAGGPAMYATIFRPVDPAARRPLGLLAFHGGGFRGGDPNGCGALAKYLALTLGVTTVAASYRLATATQKTFPDVLADGALAWRWFIGRAAELGVDPNRIAVSGESAGVLCSGHLAVGSPFVGFKPNEPRPAGWIAQWGPVDFIARWFDRGESAGAEDWLLGTHYAANPQIYHEASIVAYARAPLPPAVFIYGRQDRVVHPRQGELGAAAWKAAGAPATLRVINNIGHGCVGDNRKERFEVIHTAAEFYDAHIASKS